MTEPRPQMSGPDDGVVEALEGPKTAGSASLAMRKKKPNFRIVFGGVLIFLVLFIAVFAPFLATHDPLELGTQRLAPPGRDHLFGTDQFGRDVFSRVMYGSRTSLAVGSATVILSTLFGTIIGLLSGYYRRVDGIIMRAMDAFMAFPSILLAIAIMAALGPNSRNVVIALTITYTPRTARVVRGKVLGVREEAYVESARAIGLGDIKILRTYILANVLAPLMVQATFILALAIIAEAGLSYIGAGTPPPTPSWGNILSDGRAVLSIAPWMTTFPGVFIMVSVLGLNILGDGLRDVLDPRLKDVQ